MPNQTTQVPADGNWHDVPNGVQQIETPPVACQFDFTSSGQMRVKSLDRLNNQNFTIDYDDQNTTQSQLASETQS